jgi:hypothetical protein
MKSPSGAVQSDSAALQMPGVFRFETDFAGSLHCVPMSVRMKLDQVGIKLSLKQWNRIPHAERRQLIEQPCDGASGTESYKRNVAALIEKHTSTAVEFAAVDESPAWAETNAVPERICEWARSVGVAPPTLPRWAALTPLQRFALFKLTRPGHSNDNFLPAMREFGILT